MNCEVVDRYMVEDVAYKTHKSNKNPNCERTWQQTGEAKTRRYNYTLIKSYRVIGTSLENIERRYKFRGEIIMDVMVALRGRAAINGPRPPYLRRLRYRL